MTTRTEPVSVTLRRPAMAAVAPVRRGSLRASSYPNAFGSGFLAVARWQTRRWDRALGQIELEQERVLKAILRRAQGTVFGRRHDFAGVEHHRDFVQRVPVGDYDSVSHSIDRMRLGWRNLLVPEAVRYFGNSSGASSAGKPKFLPITERQIVEQRRAGADALMRYLTWANDATFPRGFTIGLFPSTTMRREGEALITSNPALMVTRMPALTRPVYLPDDDIRQMSAYDAKLSAIADRYLDWDVRAIAGTTCWFTLLFDKVLETASRRGRRVRGVADIWPNLRVLLGGGVSAAPYLPILREQMGRDITLVDTYNATEGGIYAASDFSGAPGMLMLPHRGTFFELVPLEEHHLPTPTRVPLWSVERDRPYAIVVTTTSGLYAYKLGDIVRFPSIDPLRIEFVGRLSGCLSVTQELTTHVEIERAVAHAIERCPCRTIDFGAGAEFGIEGTGKSRYVLFVEFDQGAEPASVVDFAAAFDAGLCRENRVYREHRAGDVAILPPRVAAIVPGGARRFLDQVTSGNLQGKFPRIVGGEQQAKLISLSRTTVSHNGE